MDTGNTLDLPPRFGEGLNSFRIRFTLMAGFFGALVAGMTLWWFAGHDHQIDLGSDWIGFIALVAAILASSATTYLMTGKLTRPIENLKASTEAIALGDYDTKVMVECQCEVGGLADSFRMMVARLNANVSKINSLAYEDGVTGLPNRAVLFELLEKSAANQGFLLFIDLDRFKQVNDIHGHHVGDTLLRHVANRIFVEGLESTPENVNNGLLPSDRPVNAADSKMLFRFAGDEFVCLIAEDKSTEEVSALADRLVELLTRPFLLMDRTIRIGASIGVARLGVDSASAEELIRFADIAMYDAKQNGRSRVSFFDDNMRKAAIDNASLERDFAVAIDRGELEVHYQPKMSLADNSVTGLEALVRWRHPERGLLYPASFIKIAESGGYLDKLGREVMKTAARDIAAWRSQGRSYRVAINVCPSQFADDMFVSNLTNYVRLLGASPADFELEVTETIAMANPENARSHLIRLREAGFLASIDDFGMGFSNLAQLTRLPYHCLKIDKSLIDDVVENQDSRTIVSSIIAMAHGLGQVVVAEGVESGAQMEVLGLLGCDIVQGYFISRPIPFNEVADKIASLRDVPNALHQPIAYAVAS